MAGNAASPAGNDVSVAGKAVPPAGNDVSVAGNAASSTGNGVSPAGKAVSFTGNAASPAGNEASLPGNGASRAGKAVSLAGREAPPAGNAPRRTMNAVRLAPFALGWLLAACSTSGTPTGGAGAVDSSAGDASHGLDAAAVDARGDSGPDGSSCACPAAGACDTSGCPPDYSGPAFAAWCAAVQASAAGHVVAMRACGSLLMMTYGTDGGCERGYVVDQPGGALVATLDECNATVFSCGSLQPSACVPGCCLDKSCTLGITSLCPPWEPDAGDDAN